MDTQTDDFSPQQSLQVIQEMIEKAKDSVADKSFYFLLWGWLVFAAALIQFLIKVIVRSGLHPYAWNLMFLGVIISIFYSRREKLNRRVRSYVDDNIAYLWTALFITHTLFVFVFAEHGDWEHCYTFFISLYSLGCYATGRILKFRPLVWGAVGGWMLTILSIFTSEDYNILILALAILLSYIIPGYLLRREHKKNKRA